MAAVAEKILPRKKKLRAKMIFIIILTANRKARS